MICVRAPAVSPVVTSRVDSLRRDVEVRSLEPSQSQPRQRDLCDSEQARHQKLVTEFDLVDVDAGGEMPSPAQAERAHRRRAEIQLFEIQAHAPTALTTAQTAPQMAALFHRFQHGVDGTEATGKRLGHDGLACQHSMPREELLCDVFDRALAVSRYLLDAAPGWLEAL